MAQVKLGDVAVESRETYKGDKTGMPIVGLEHITPGEVTLSNWDTDTDNTFTKRFRKGDMLFGRRRAYLKKAAQAPFDGICSGDITVIRAKEDLLLPELLPFIIQNDNLFDFAVGKSAGSLSPRVKWDNLKNYTFELPPMEEQKELAEALWSINDTLQAYQNLLTETNALVQAQFVEMFGARTNCTIGDVCQLINGDRSKNYPNGKDRASVGIPFINAGHLDGGKVNFSEMDYITPQKYAQMTQGKVQNEDILYCLRGSLGKHGIVDFENGLIASSLVIIRCNKQKILPLFLLNVLESDGVAVQLHATTNGSSQPNLSAASVKNYKIPLPQMKEQVAFVQFYECINNSKSALQNTITSLRATKRCILEGALRIGRKE